MYLGWFDDTPKKSGVEKLQEAILHYKIKFGDEPNVCLVSANENVEYGGLTIKPVGFVRPNYYWIGRDDAAGEAAGAGGTVPATQAA